MIVLNLYFLNTTASLFYNREILGEICISKNFMGDFIEVSDVIKI